MDLCDSALNQSIGISHLIKEDWTKVLVELVSEAIVTNIWRNTCGLILSTQVLIYDFFIESRTHSRKGALSVQF